MNTSGSTDVLVCLECGGTKLCSACQGRGGHGHVVPPTPGDPEPPLADSWKECPACKGTGACPSCSAGT